MFYDTTTLNYNWQVWESDAFSVYAGITGVIDSFLSPGTNVARGQTLAQVPDPYDSSVRERLTAPLDGVIFFAQEDPLTYAGSWAYKLIRE